MQRERSLRGYNSPINRLLLSAALLLLSGCSTTILYEGGSIDNPQIMRLDCRGERPLALPTTDNRRPRWSPDGQLVAYRGEDAGGPAIFLTNRLGGSVTNLTGSHVDLPGLDYGWSPDSRWIYYSAANPTSGTEIVYRVGVDPVSAPQPLTPFSLDSREPSVSPSGDRIVYSSDSPSSRGDFDLYTANANGSNRTLLLRNAGIDDRMPVWGPDGRIVYVTDGAGDRNVKLIEADGRAIATLSTAGYAGFASRRMPDLPAWSPDGDRVAFTGGGGKIHVASTAPPYDWTCLSCDAGVGLHIDETPRWMPADSQLVFGRWVGRLPPTGSPTGLFRRDGDGSNEALLAEGGFWPDPRPLRRVCFCLGSCS